MIVFDPPDDSPLATSVPCIVELSVGGGVEHRWYGPFACLIDARDWCAKQRPSHFQIIPLRRTDRDRSQNDDWYLTHYDDRNEVIDDFYPADKFLEWEESR